MEKLNGKNILVTGGTGFVGSHLVESLKKFHANVIVPYRSIDPRSYFILNHVVDMVTLVICDIVDKQRVYEIVSKYSIEYIIHLAAQAIVPTAYENPINTIETNILGTSYILDAARQFSHVKGVIVASSDKCYGKTNKPYIETDALRGDHPYDVSKSATDLLAHTYWKTYGIPVVTTRFGNIYGQGDLNISRIIPSIIHAIILKKPVEIRSDGTFVRQFVHVDDVVRGYISLLQHIESTKGEAYNFGSEECYSVIEVIHKIEKILQIKIPYVVLNTAHNEICYQRLDYQKIQKQLGWKPKCSLSNSIKNIIRWYKHMYRQYNIL